ncbi:MAG: acetate kinase [Candidatus Riflebacteria bacterium]|nr:acetate kinase [Candidatus Riflebacteria bacterium]
MEKDKIILVLNCGSSSLKYDVIKMPSRESLGKGIVERIGNEKGILEQKVKGQKYKIEEKIEDHKKALELVIKAITDKDTGIVKNISEINGIGHRVVHGGDKYASSVIIDDTVIKAIEECIDIAPLHNPPNLTGIRVAKELMPNLPQVAVFDTAFHQTMPPHAFLYGIPRKMYEDYKIRRYGFHGTSHRYVSARALEICKRDVSNTNIITCHLGNGASITAIEKGKSIDTSMGFTPLEGLMMGTRSGSLDPAILGYLMNKGMSIEEVMNILNKKSGLLGLSGISNDMRDVEAAAEAGNKDAKEALDIFTYRIKRYIGSYCAALDKVDILVFTGGIGENGWESREAICKGLENLGIMINYEVNKGIRSKETIISHPYSPVTILVVPTNEELQIAIDVYDLAFGA